MGKNQDPGSGINIPDLPHWIQWIWIHSVTHIKNLMQFFNRSRWAGPPQLPSPLASIAGERRTRSSSCALPRSSTSSSWWWQDSTGSSRLGRCSGSASATVLNLATILKLNVYWPARWIRRKLGSFERAVLKREKRHKTILSGLRNSEFSCRKLELIGIFKTTFLCLKKHGKWLWLNKVISKIFKPH